VEGPNPLAGSGNCRLFSESGPINISQVVSLPSAAAATAGLLFPERISRLKKYNNNNNNNNNNNISFLV